MNATIGFVRNVQARGDSRRDGGRRDGGPRVIYRRARTATERMGGPSPD